MFIFYGARLTTLLTGCHGWSAKRQADTAVAFRDISKMTNLCTIVAFTTANQPGRGDVSFPTVSIRHLHYSNRPVKILLHLFSLSHLSRRGSATGGQEATPSVRDCCTFRNFRSRSSVLLLQPPAKLLFCCFYMHELYGTYLRVDGGISAIKRATRHGQKQLPVVAELKQLRFGLDDKKNKTPRLLESKQADRKLGEGAGAVQHDRSAWRCHLPACRRPQRMRPLTLLLK